METCLGVSRISFPVAPYSSYHTIGERLADVFNTVDDFLIYRSLSNLQGGMESFSSGPFGIQLKPVMTPSLRHVAALP
jgi:hypothetical protein